MDIIHLFLVITIIYNPSKIHTSSESISGSLRGYSSYFYREFKNLKELNI